MAWLGDEAYGDYLRVTGLRDKFSDMSATRLCVVGSVDYESDVLRNVYTASISQVRSNCLAAHLLLVDGTAFAIRKDLDIDLGRLL